MSSSFNPSIFEGFRSPEVNLEAARRAASSPMDRSAPVRFSVGCPTVKNDFPERFKALFRVRRKSIIVSNQDLPTKHLERAWKTLERQVVTITGTCWSKVRPRVKYDEREPDPDLETGVEQPEPEKRGYHVSWCAKAVSHQVKKFGEKLKKLTSRRKRTFHMNISPSYKHGMDYEGLVTVVDEALTKFRKAKAARKAAEEAKLIEAERQMFLRAQRVALGGRVTVESVRVRDWDWDFDDEDDYYPAW